MTIVVVKDKQSTTIIFSGITYHLGDKKATAKSVAGFMEEWGLLTD
jgi:hypothetical protein